MKRRIIRTLQGFLTFVLVLVTDIPIAIIGVYLGLAYMHAGDVKNMLLVAFVAALAMILAVFLWTALVMPCSKKRR